MRQTRRVGGSRSLPIGWRWRTGGRRRAGRRLRLLDRREDRLTGDQPRPAAVGQEAPCPADDHDDPVREPDQVHEMDAEPQEPGREATLSTERAEPWDIRDPGEPADDGDVAAVAVAEGLHRLAIQSSPDRPCGVAPALDAALGDAWHRSVL